MSAVLCLPACLCVSTAASRGQAPHGNASKAFHRRGVTYPSRATRGHMNPQHHGLRSAARQQRRVREGGVATGTPTSASSFSRPAPAALPATSTASTATPRTSPSRGMEKPPSSDPARRPGGDPPGPPWRRPVRTPRRMPTKWTPRRRTSGKGRTPLTGQTWQRPSWRTPWGPRRPTRER